MYLFLGWGAGEGALGKQIRNVGYFLKKFSRVGQDNSFDCSKKWLTGTAQGLNNGIIFKIQPSFDKLNFLFGKLKFF